MKNMGFFLFMLLVMIGFYSLVSSININNGENISSSPTASVYLLPMQQDTYVFKVTAEKANVLTAPGGDSIYQLSKGDQVTANCDFSNEPGWCQIAEGRLKGYYFWQGCTNRAGDFQVTDEC